LVENNNTATKDDNNQSIQRPKSSSIIRPKKKEDPNEILRGLYKAFKDKEKKNQELDDKIFAFETIDKKLKNPQSAEMQNKISKQENTWVGNGVGVRTQPEASKSRSVQKLAGSQALAEHFLKGLESNINRTGKLGIAEAATKGEKPEAKSETEIQPKPLSKKQKEKFRQNKPNATSSFRKGTNGLRDDSDRRVRFEK